MGCDYSKAAQEEFNSKIAELNQKINYLQTQHAALKAELFELKQKSEADIPIEDIQTELGIQIKNIEDLLLSIQRSPTRKQTASLSRTEEYDFTPDPSAMHVESASNTIYSSSSSNESDSGESNTVEAVNFNKGVIMDDPYIKAMVEFKRKQLGIKPTAAGSTRDTEIMKHAIYPEN